MLTTDFVEWVINKHIPTPGAATFFLWSFNFTRNSLVFSTYGFIYSVISSKKPCVPAHTERVMFPYFSAGTVSLGFVN